MDFPPAGSGCGGACGIRRLEATGVEPIRESAGSSRTSCNSGSQLHAPAELAIPLARIAYLRVGLRARGLYLAHAPARTSPTGTEVTMAHVATKPIDLYFWPTPNGWKISIMP